MKKILYVLLSVFLLSSIPTSVHNSTLEAKISDSVESIRPEVQHQKVAQLITYLLEKNHYNHLPLSDSLSSEIFERYISGLDFNRLYFIKEDIASFETIRFKQDDFLSKGFVQPAFDIFNIYIKRANERLDYIDKLLNKEFDFSKDEDYIPDREKEPWAVSQTQLDSIWYLRVKNDALNLKLTGKNLDKISETLKNRYANLRKRVAQFNGEDVFQIYMNAVCESYDPHTNYFSPKSFDDFKIKMSLSLEGIGALLSSENDFTKVVEIIPGGPADKSNLLHANDRIIGVGQENEKEFVDVIGWRIDDVVQLIRGPKLTKVYLQVLKAAAATDTQPDTICLVRDKVKLEDNAAKSDTLDVLHEGKPYRFGVIHIPAFYYDYDARQKGDPDYKSTTRDVRRLLEELENAGVDGIIVDLRENGGGYLNEATELTGLFIDKGPVVQVRDSYGSIKVEWDDDAGVVYSGPLAVIVDRFSASASEIFAAAIQDYNRGIIIGGQSFGKGTVQNAVDLNRYLRNSPGKLGQMKMTMAKFYRINGGSTQHVGVIPDIDFPSRFNVMEVGESSQKNSLMWDQISAMNFQKVNDYSNIIPKLKTRHTMRLADDKRFKELTEQIDRYKKDSEQTIFSLNEEKRRKQRDERKKDSPENDPEMTMDNPHLANRTDNDLMLTEGAHILGDLILLTKSN